MIFPWLTGTVIKAVLIALMVYVAHKWSTGGYDKGIRTIKQLGKEYGVVTIALLIVWWILTPSGMPDDAVMVWIVAKLGVVPYLIILGALTSYLVWRMRVTIIIYRK